MECKDVIILGAGLSGLACALTLQKQGVSFLIVESDRLIGGRVKSKFHDYGFIIDQGFQVILSSYPELKKFVDLSDLNLKKFNSGALVYNGESLDLIANPFVHFSAISSIYANKFITFKDKALTLKLILSSQFQRNDAPLGKRTTLQFLQDQGFSKDFIEYFWRPFLAGVYLDNDLQVGEYFFKFLVRCFVSGNVTIPSSGISELPKKMAHQISKDAFVLGQPAQSWSFDEVILKDGKKLKAKNVICAFDSGIRRNEAPATAYRSVETFYFTSRLLKQLNWGKWLVLVPQKFGLGISHLCLISEVAPAYAKPKSLLSVSVVAGKRMTSDQIIRDVNMIAKRDLELEFVESVFIEKALPQVSTEIEGFGQINGVIHCGDHWASPSINGALRSGRLAAEFVFKKGRKAK